MASSKKKKAKQRTTWAFPAIVLFLLVLLVVCHRPLARLYFVKEYAEPISSASETYGVPEYLLCGVIWTESHFDPTAVSSAGGCGLMQMKLTTFNEMRSRMKLSGEGSVFAPEENIRCGAFYLRYLYDLYQDWDTALAAYNAGLGNVGKWLDDPAYSDDGKSLKEIPFEETKQYVKKVRYAEKIYQYLYDYQKKEE